MAIPLEVLSFMQMASMAMALWFLVIVPLWALEHMISSTSASPLYHVHITTNIAEHFGHQKEEDCLLTHLVWLILLPFHGCYHPIAYPVQWHHIPEPCSSQGFKFQTPLQSEHLPSAGMLQKFIAHEIHSSLSCHGNTIYLKLWPSPLWLITSHCSLSCYGNTTWGPSPIVSTVSV